MRPCRHPVVTLCTPSVGVVLHPVTGCAHTKTKTETLDRDLRLAQIAKAQPAISAARGLWRKREPGSNVGSRQETRWPNWKNCINAEIISSAVSESSCNSITSSSPIATVRSFPWYSAATFVLPQKLVCDGGPDEPTCCWLRDAEAEPVCSWRAGV